MSASLFLSQFLLFQILSGASRANIIHDSTSDLRDPNELFRQGQHYRYGDACIRSTPYDCSMKVLDFYKRAWLLIVENRSPYSFDLAGMLNDLGVIYYENSDQEEAIKVYNAAIHVSPTSTPALANLAGLESGRGNFTAAATLYERAVLSSPRSALLRYNFGIFLYKLGRKEEAKIQWEESLAFDSSLYQSMGNLATLQCSDGNITTAQALYERAINLAQIRQDSEGAQSLLFQQKAGVIPTITASIQHSLSVRTEYINNLLSLLQSDADSLPAPLQAIGCTSLGYYAVYHGYEDLYIRQLLAKVYAKLSKTALTYTAPFLLPPANSHYNTASTYAQQQKQQQQQRRQEQRPRIKVGFLSAFFYRHSVGLLLQGVIKKLNRDIFQVYIITVEQPPQARDDVTQSLEDTNNAAEAEYWSKSYGSTERQRQEQRLVFHLYGLPLAAVREQVALLQLDILVFGELGMDPTTYFLAFSRLAKRSVVFWGHAVTSGITAAASGTAADSPRDGRQLSGTMEISEEERGGPDYFISSVLFEGKMNIGSSYEYQYEHYRYNEERRYNSSNHVAAAELQQQQEQHSQQQQERQQQSAEWGILKKSTSLAQLDYAERLILMDGMTTYFERPKPPLSAAQLNLTARDDGNKLIRDDAKKITTVGIDGRIETIVLPRKRDFLLHLDPTLSNILPPEPITTASSSFASATASAATASAATAGGATASSAAGSAASGSFRRGSNNEQQGNEQSASAQKKGTIISIRSLFGKDGKITIAAATTAPTATATAAEEGDTNKGGCDSGKTHSDEESFHLYGVPQTLYKLHADFDGLLRGVLERDPLAYIVLPRGQDSVWTDMVLARLRQSLRSSPTTTTSAAGGGSSSGGSNNGILYNGISNGSDDGGNLLRRVIFVRQMSEREYLTFCAIVDVILDPFPVGGGRSSLEIFSTGTPVVMLYPRTSILQLTYAMYETMGILQRRDCCIAFTAEEFVEKVVALGTNHSLRHEIRYDILRNNHRLYENISVVHEWEKMLQYIVSAPRPAPGLFGIDTVRALAQETFGQNYYRPSVSGRANNAAARPEATVTSTAEIMKDIEFHWVKSELESVVFTYMAPPIYLRDVVVFAADHITSSTSPEFHNSPVQSEVVSAAAETMATKPPQYVFIGNFTDVDREGVIRSFQIIVPADQDWRAQCALQVLSIGISDKLKILYLCTQVGIAAEKWKRKVSLRLPIAIELPDGSISSDDLSLIVHEHDDVSQTVWQFVRTHNLSTEAEVQLTGQILSKYISPDTVGSPISVRARWEVSRQWLLWMQSVYVRTQQFAPSTMKPGKILMLSSLDGLDRLSPACAATASVGSESAGSDRGTAPDSGPSESGSSQAGSFESESITVGVTSSKRIKHFLSTMTALEDALGPLPNSYIKEVIVVDDGSSDADRQAMVLTFPRYRYIFKDIDLGIHGLDSSTEALRLKLGIAVSRVISTRGHASSMNVLVNAVHTRYFLYLEDDWRLLSRPVLHSSLAQLVDAYSSATAAPTAAPTTAAIAGEGSQDKQQHPFRSLLLGALAILRAAGYKSTSTSTNANVESEERVHQVLFNEQSRRACAVAAANCDVSVIGRGGWARSIYTTVTGPNSANAVVDVTVPYSLHEFGLYTGGVAPYGGREHEFTYWPSLSLNPGLWDLTEIKRGISQCRLPAYSKSVVMPGRTVKAKAAAGALQSADHSSASSSSSATVHHKKQTANSQTTHTTIRKEEEEEEEEEESSSSSNSNDGPPPSSVEVVASLRRIFEESDRLFEQRFSATALAAGLRMAYLPALLFEHTGDDVSAYVLNDMKRPWDNNYR